jgi:hypothetical protein
MKEIEIKSAKAIINGEEFVGIETNVGTLKVSHWKQKRITIFNGVEFKIPSAKCEYMKFVPERYRLDEDGTISQMPGYWNCGVFADGVLVTRCYYHENNRKTKTRIPLGVTTVGTVEVILSENKKSGEKRVIINHFYSEKKQSPATMKATIAGEKPKKGVFEMQIPNSPNKKAVRIIAKK